MKLASLWKVALVFHQFPVDKLLEPWQFLNMITISSEDGCLCHYNLKPVHSLLFGQDIKTSF